MFLHPMSKNLSILASSIVDLVPSLTVHSSCINEFSCSCKSIKPKSVLAKANVSLPVVGDTFKGTTTPISSSSSANCLLLANFLRTSSVVSQFNLPCKPSKSSCFSVVTSSSLSTKIASLIFNRGCVNILMVISINSISDFGNSSIPYSS